MERERRKKLCRTQGKKLWGKKDGEETNSKEKQDEGEPGRGKADFPLFFFFILALQFTVIRWLTIKHHFLENPYPKPTSSTQ